MIDLDQLYTLSLIISLTRAVVVVDVAVVIVIMCLFLSNQHDHR